MTPQTSTYVLGSRQKIAVVTSSYPQHDEDPSGHFVRSEVRALVRAGNEVWVLCPGTPRSNDLGGDQEQILRLGAGLLFGWPGALARLRSAPWRLVLLPSFVLRAQRALRTGGFDRVVAHWLLPCAWPLCLPITNAPRTIPLEVVVHGSDARLLHRFPAPLRAAILGKLREAGTTLRVVAPHLKQQLHTPGFEQWLERALVKPCPLDINEQYLTARQLNRESARCELGVPQEAFLAVVAGRLIAQKRVAQALTQAPLPPGAVCVVVGSGPLEAGLRRQFPHVRFTGQLSREQTLRWLLSADVVLNASRVEGLPTVVREARALGVAVWTAAFEGAREWAARDPGIHLVFEQGSST